MAEEAMLILHEESKTEKLFSIQTVNWSCSSKLPLILLTRMIFGENFSGPLSGLLMVMQDRFSSHSDSLAGKSLACVRPGNFDPGAAGKTLGIHV